MSGIVDDILDISDDIYGIRDEIGAVKKEVFFVTRTWSGDKRGEGSAEDTEEQMLPSPWVKEYAHDVRIVQGGSVQAGDILLKTISKKSFTEDDLDDKSDVLNVEHLYRVGDKIYTVIQVTEDYVHFSVQLRKLSNQQRYV